MSVTKASRAARSAIGALALNVGVHVLGLVFAVWQLAVLWPSVQAGELVNVSLEELGGIDSRGSFLQIANLGCLALGAIFFLRWLAAAYRTVNPLRVLGCRMTSGEACVSFFIPILNFLRPYQAVRDLDAGLEPSEVLDPALRPRADAGTPGYRESAAARDALPKTATRAPVVVWWALWLGGCFRLVGVGGQAFGDLERILIVALAVEVIELGASLAAILVVRRIDARMQLRARRLAALEAVPS